jgi:hypothetical protein
MTKVNREQLIAVMKKKEFCAFNFRYAVGNFSTDSGLPAVKVELQTSDGHWYETTMRVFESLKDQLFTIGSMKQ